jgi:hypothetical protein
MLKRISFILLAITLLFVTSYNLHHYLINEEMFFSLFNIYLFHAVFAILIYICIEIVADKLPNQAGYAYLMLMCFKIGAFVLIFQASVFSLEVLSRTQRLALVVPLFLFLIAEALAVAKLLNSK